MHDVRHRLAVRRRSQITRFAVLCVVTLLSRGSMVHAQQLPIQQYGVGDGLAHAMVGAAYHDRKGYMWFGTAEGLSRFDGYSFTNYGIADGLGSAVVTSIAEDRFGRLWVGTLGGLARLVDDPVHPAGRETPRDRRVSPAARFVRYNVGPEAGDNSVSAIFAGSDGSLWCVTDGLYRIHLSSAHAPATFERVIPFEKFYSARAMADSHGRTWASRDTQLFSVVQGRVVEYGLTNGFLGAPQVPVPPMGSPLSERITALAEDARGRVFAATLHHVFEFEPGGEPDSRGRWRRLPLALDVLEEIRALAPGADETLWIGTSKGLVRHLGGRPTGGPLSRWLPDQSIMAILRDRDGNLWVGTRSAGISKIPVRPILSYTMAQGLPDPSVSRVIEGIDGRVYASTQSGGFVTIAGGRAQPIAGSQVRPFNNVGSRILRDRHGDWWIHTDEALYRFDGPALQVRTGRRFTAADGLPPQSPHSGPGLFEDRAGRIWVAGAAHDPAVFVYDPQRQHGSAFERVPLDEVQLDGFMEMVSDPAGVLWAASHGKFARLIAGAAVPFARAAGLPDTRVRALFVDRRGWLWAGLRSGGVSVTRNPTAPSPVFANYSVRHGLSSDAVWAITEDAFGRIYLGTGRGLERLDPETGQIRSFTISDGLIGSAHNHLLTDRQGHVWIATSAGLSMLTPRAAPDAVQPPAIYLSSIQVTGEAMSLPDRGSLHVSRVGLKPSSHVSIGYVALSSAGPHGLRYRYKLEGAHADWSPLTEHRAVTYASLGSGSYRFAVEAVDREGRTSAQPAVFEFDVLPPVWRRAWFLSLTAVGAAAVCFGLYRLRERQMQREFAVVLGERNRMAREIHDTLAQGFVGISMQLESVRETLTGAPVEAARHLERARELTRASLTDARRSVRELRPRALERQSLALALGELARTMTSSAATVHFSAHGAARQLPFDLEDNIYRIAQEAVTNAVKHSGASRIDIALHFLRGGVRLTVDDDGCGISSTAAAPAGGFGLTGIRERAARLGGELRIEPRRVAGTRVDFLVTRGAHGLLRAAVVRLGLARNAVDPD